LAAFDCWEFISIDSGGFVAQRLGVVRQAIEIRGSSLVEYMIGFVVIWFNFE
jgi:hypothetical protein